MNPHPHEWSPRPALEQALDGMDRALRAARDEMALRRLGEQIAYIRLKRGCRR